MLQRWLPRAAHALERGSVYLRRKLSWRGPGGRGAGLLLLVSLAAPACQGGPNIFSLDDDRQLGEQAYGQILQDQKIVKSGSAFTMVNRLKDRLVAAARTDNPEIVDRFDWEVTLIEDDQTVNAFALPGGKMAVYTGILPVAQTEAGLAVVMGHEIAHVIARHGTKAMTRQTGAAALIQILLKGDAQNIAGLASNLLNLRFGRGAEMESDRMGLRIMALAGYDPRVAASFWSRMAQLGGEAPPQWLSTHPTNEARIQQIEDLLPETVPIYEANKAKNP
jgi:metalloendopeptidase OMA1, mitochondrial